VGLLGDGVQAMSDPDIVARLRIATLPSVCCVKREAADEIERLRKERDEARREVCGFAASDIDRANRIEVKGLVSGLLAVSRKPTRPVDIARSRNWDCFKEASDEG
jgi:hypothetical protein